jgi:glycosyltransferase involved in cell wall biosynthesis
MAVITVLFYCFIVVTLIQLLYYFIFLNYFSLQRPEASKLKNVPVSIIVCAKNEAENLKVNLPHILNQNYLNFEIVLVNDSSWDDTLEVMKAFKEQYSSIQIVDVKTTEQFWGNKKYALTLGIKAAKNDFLLFTDADCKPASKDWISSMGSKFSNSKSLILGYGGYKKIKFSFLNKLIRFETVMTAIQYFAYAKLGMPYMGVGRNLAYRKELFFNNSGFMNHMNIKSGDDDLFVNEIASDKNTAICFSKDSFTVSEPKTSFKDWFIQKRRHVSTSKYYKKSHKLALGLFYISQFSFWALAIILLSSLFQWQIVIGLIAFRFLVQLINFGYAAKKLEASDLIFLAPVFELFLISMQFSIFIANLISKPNHWK